MVLKNKGKVTEIITIGWNPAPIQERLRDIAIETLRYFSSELLIQFLKEQILDFCDNAKRGEIWPILNGKKEKNRLIQRICSLRFFCQIASDLNLKQKEFEKFELLKSTSKSTLIHVGQAVSGAFRW